MKPSPKFSIITPTHNRVYILWKAISSVLKQTASDWEMLIIDDGSTDSTKKLVAEFQNDSRIKYYYQTNKGVSAARNYGCKEARGDIIVYLDSDDELYPNFLEVVSHSLQDGKNFGICNHNRSYELLDSDSNIIGIKVDQLSQFSAINVQDIYDWNVKPTASGLFYKREKFSGKTKWVEDLHIEDFEFMLQLVNHDPKGFVHIPMTLVNYKQRYGSDGLCSNVSYKDWVKAIKKIYELHKNDELMKSHDKYKDLLKKYEKLAELEEKSEIVPQMYKYFPGKFDKSA